MKKHVIACLAGAAALCCLAACGGESLSASTPSVSSAAASQSEASSQPEPTQQPAEAGLLTADLPVEGSLQPVESDIFAGYDHFSAFKNGWAFVLKGNQAGYLSESGEYKPLYTISEEELYSMNLDDIPGSSSPRREDIYFLTQNFACGKNGVVPYYQDGKWGYSDLDGNIIVPPQYTAVEPMNGLALGHRDEEGGAYGGHYVYDLLNEKGEVLFTGSCWADGSLGYYMTIDEEGLGHLYNADGSLVLDNVTHAIAGNRPRPQIDLYEGGVVVDGDQCYGPNPPVEKGTIAVFDRSGNVIGENPEYEILGIESDGSMYISGDGGFGVLDKDFNLVVEPSLSLISDMDENGLRYMRTKATGKIRQYDAQLQEVESQPALTYISGESVQDEETRETIATAYLMDQDGNVVMELESRYLGDINGMYYPTTPLTEGDWMYWCPDADTIQVYHIEKAQ